MLEWMIRPETISCLLMMAAMVAGWVYCVMLDNKERYNWLFTVVAMLLLVPCVPVLQPYPVAIMSFSLLFGLLFGVSATVLTSKKNNTTLVDCLNFQQSELKKFEDDAEYGFNLEEEEFYLLCEIVLPMPMRIERRDAYNARFKVEQPCQ